jgi:hypothetical protein
MTRESRAAWRARQKATEATVDAAAGSVVAEQKAAWDAAVAAAREAKAARVKLTRDDVVGATHVRIGGLWYPVVRVNQKTVTVRGLWPWDEPVSFHKVEEARVSE